jgi:hypothetical protein
VLEPVLLVEQVRFRSMVARLQDEPMAASAPSLFDARVEQRPRRAAPAERRLDEQVGDPGLGCCPVQPQLEPEVTAPAT